MLPRIFVGGTGRSGTWLLYNILGCHEAVHTFPAEMRFLVDPDGLMDLVDALSSQYSPVRAREALFRFERLMRSYLATPGVRPYATLDLPTWLGTEHYWQQLDQFCTTLTEMEYVGWSWDIKYEHPDRLTEFIQQIRRYQRKRQKNPPPNRAMSTRLNLKLGKHFANRSELVALAAAFVDTLFLHAAHSHGKQTWCEKTPQHLLHLDFVWELFPDSAFIHVKRDPRGVVHSLTKQKWAPNDLGEAAVYLREMYSRWFVLREKFDLATCRYCEIKLEDLATSPQSVLDKVTSFCTLDNRFSHLPDIELDKVIYWQKSMSSRDIKLVNEILGPYICEMGYEL